MSDNNKTFSNGNQNSGEQRGYQPKPNGNFGYQPSSGSSNPPAPPTSGSNATKPHRD